MVRGEIGMGPLIYNAVYPKQKDGAPLKAVFPPEGVPANPYADGGPGPRSMSMQQGCI